MPEFANVMREEEENTENKYGWKNKEITRNILLIAISIMIYCTVDALGNMTQSWNAGGSHARASAGDSFCQ